jgi:hypothetical protein
MSSFAVNGLYHYDTLLSNVAISLGAVQEFSTSLKVYFFHKIWAILAFYLTRFFYL